MLDVYIGANRTLALKEAIADGMDSGQFGTLADDIRDCFTDDQVEQVEELLEGGDLDEVIDNILADWSGDSLEDLLEDLKEVMAESEISLVFDDEATSSEEVGSYDNDDDEYGEDDDDDDDFDPEGDEEQY